MQFPSNFRMISSKLFVFFVLTLFALLSLPKVEAGGWGKTEDIYKFEDTQWNGVFFDMNGLHFTAYIPNYLSTILNNGDIFIKGRVGDAKYFIYTTYNPGFTPPTSLDEFIKLIQDSNPDHIVVPVHSKKNLGAKYAVDLIPNNGENSFGRFFSTNDRVIFMHSADVNENRRVNFFDSIFIH